MEPERMNSDVWLRPEEACSITGVTERTLRNWVRRGELRHKYVEKGRKPRYHRDDLLRLAKRSFDSSTEGAQEPPACHASAIAAASSGQQLAVRLLAMRLRAEQKRVRQLEAEVAWLRARIEQAEEREAKLHHLLSTLARPHTSTRATDEERGVQ